MVPSMSKMRAEVGWEDVCTPGFYGLRPRPPAWQAISHGLERFRMADRSVTVKGLAEQAVESDFAVWTLGFRRAGNEFGAVQQALAADREKVLAFLKARGFTEAEIEPRPLIVQDLMAREFAQGNVPFRFNGASQVLVKTARVKEVGKPRSR
jgi:uncharacterized protein